MAFKLDSDLSAVNSILGSIGQAPVTTLNYENPEVGLCKNLLDETNVDVQSEGWHFNTEREYKFDVDANGRIPVPPNALNMNVSGLNVWRVADVVDRDGYLYNLLTHSNNWSTWNNSAGCVYCDVTWLFPFKGIPPVFQRYVTLKASVRAATQLVSNPQLSQLLQQQTEMQRAACMQEDCEMGDNTFFGWPYGTVYRSYQPYRTLARGPMIGSANAYDNRNPLQ